MFSGLVGLVLKALFGGIADYLVKLRQINEAEKVGRLEQASASEAQAQEKTHAAQVARDSVRVLTADDVRNIAPGTDPDFRD